MLTVREVADRLNVSTNLVYKLVSTGTLSAYRIGRAIRFSEEQIDDYLDQIRVDGNVETSGVVDLITKHLGP